MALPLVLFWFSFLRKMAGTIEITTQYYFDGLPCLSLNYLKYQNISFIRKQRVRLSNLKKQNQAITQISNENKTICLLVN